MNWIIYIYTLSREWALGWHVFTELSINDSTEYWESGVSDQSYVSRQWYDIFLIQNSLYLTYKISVTNVFDWKE